MSRGVLTAQLLAAGWTRSDQPAEYVPECGMWPGYCVNKARWTDAYGHKPMCSVHAGQMLRQQAASSASSASSAGSAGSAGSGAN